MSTILLVEDQPDNQMVIEDLFEFDDIGADLVVVGSAEDALDRIPELNPILVLMDLGLPGMSGVEAVRLLKADAATAAIPVWALTAHAMSAVRDEAVAAGCSAYVTKPVDAGALADRLRGFVGGVLGKAA